MGAPYQPDDDCETHEWRNPAGETVRFVTRTEATARMMPPVSITTIRVPQAHGARYRAARHDERLVGLPVVLPGPQTDRAELRRWAKALDPVPGLGTLTVIGGPHAGRMLRCVYEAGLDDFAEDEPSIGLTTLAFRAPDPYWLDSTESTIELHLGSTSYTWFPFLPLVLGTSDVFGQTTITNGGDVDAWPVVTVIGPGTELSLSNSTTGKTTRITGNIAAGSVVEVDTRPGYKTVRVDGYNAFGRLTDDSTLWPLVPGPNRVSIGFATADANSSVAFRWRGRWLAA